MMKKSVLFAAFLAAGLTAGVAQADEAMATAKGCMACHKTDMKLVGPSYKDVARCHIYTDEAARKDCPEGTNAMKDKDVVAELAAKVKAGGSGVWGPIPMPPNAALSDEDAKSLVTWVMSLGGAAAPAAAAPAGDAKVEAKEEAKASK